MCSQKEPHTLTRQELKTVLQKKMSMLLPYYDGELADFVEDMAKARGHSHGRQGDLKTLDWIDSELEAYRKVET